MDCIGRFQFTVPEGMAAGGRSQSISTVDVSTAPLPPGGAKVLWKERVARISALTTPPGAPRSVARMFQLQTAVPGIWYFRSRDSPNLLALEAIKEFPDHALIVNRGADLDAPQRQIILQGGSEAIVETLVKNIINAYVPASPRGFCVGYGSITTKPSRNEETNIVLQHRALPGVEIRIRTRTVAEPDTQTYSNLSEESDLATATGSQMTVLRDAPRVVAGLPGKEMRVSVTPPDESPFVRFTWHFTGVPRRADQPAIDIVGTAQASHVAELEPAWESLLSSVRPVPL